MQVQEKNIKGFNILELIVVLAIIGVISAAAYPKFSTWKQSREVRTDALKVKKIFEYKVSRLSCLINTFSEFDLSTLKNFKTL